MHKALKPIGGIYTQVSPEFQRGLYEGGVRCLKAATHDAGVVLEVEVKEATKKGFAVARGGETQSTSRCQEAKQEEEESG